MKMSVFQLSLLLMVSWLLLTAMAAAIGEAPKLKPGENIFARLEGGGGMVECWNALVELKSCTSEIILFFLNGESYLGMDCCRAIRIITYHCWPSMLTSLGYTAEEGDILKDYCGSSSSSSSPQPAPARVLWKSLELN